MRKDSLKVVLGILVTLQTAALSPVASPADQSPAPPTTRPAKAQHPRIQPRDAKADPHLIDLTNYYTLALTEDPSGAFGYTLDALPRGVQQIGNVQYDLRGIVQVSGQQFGGAKKIPGNSCAISKSFWLMTARNFRDGKSNRMQQPFKAL